MKNRIALLITLLGVTFLSPMDIHAQKEQSKTFKGVKSIRMNTSSGSCKIQKSSDATVTVQVRYAFDGQVEPTMEQDGDRLVIKEIFHEKNTRGGSDWTLTVPDDMNIKFQTGSGTLEAANMKLELNVTTGSGDLIFDKITGKIHSNTGSGDLELTNFNGEIDVNIGSGTAAVQNSQGQIKINCGSGNIRVADSKAAFSVNTGSGNVASRNITLNGSSKFNSGSGDAMVTLAAGPQHDISVNSGSGDAELNFNGNEIVGEIIMKASKENGSITAPFEFDKVEEIANGNNNIMVKKTVVKGNAAHRVQVSTGSGDAVLRK